MPFLAPIGAAIVGGLGAVGGGSAIAGAAGLASGIGGLIGGAGGGKNLTAGERAQLQTLSDFQGAVNAGPGTADISAGAQAKRDFAASLQQAQQQGLGPTQQDIQGAQDLSGRLFRQQEVGLEQNFLQQQQGFAQQAALQGRNPLDPVFRNKLAQEQTRQQQQLQAQQGEFATMFAQQQPGQRLSLQKQRADVLGGLATQALANRQALASMGQSAAGIQPQGSGAGGVLGGLAGGLQGFQGGMNAGLQIENLKRQLGGSTSGGALNADQFSIQNTLGGLLK